MKILMLTDFSENANHAAKNAVRVFHRLHADILLYHTYYDHRLGPEYSGGQWVADEFIFRRDESNAQLSQLAIQLRHIISGMIKDGFKPKTEYQCGDGSLGKNAEVIVQENQVGLVVMGARGANSIDHLLFGSGIMGVIEKASCPVVIIPPKAETQALKKVTLALAFELADINAINYLIRLSKQLNFQLEIVHVKVIAKKGDPAKEKTIMDHVNAIKHDHQVTFLEIKGKDVVNRLNKFCKESGSDLLALVHSRDGFWSGLFARSTTAKALDKQYLSIMVIPSEMTADRL